MLEHLGEEKNQEGRSRPSGRFLKCAEETSCCEEWNKYCVRSALLTKLQVPDWEDGSVSKMPVLKPKDLSLDVHHPCERMHVTENHMTLALEKQKQEGPWDCWSTILTYSVRVTISDR